MKPTDIHIGSVYDLKVGRNTTPVRIMQAAPAGGWEAVTLSGNKPVVIQSAERLVGPHSPQNTPTPPWMWTNLQRALVPLTMR